MDNVVVNKGTSQKHLKVIFNNDRTWHEHISEITAKALERVNILQSLKYQLDRKSLQTMYFSFVRPILEYADITLDKLFNHEKDTTEKVQIETGKVVLGQPNPVQEFNSYRKLGWKVLK